MEAADSPALCCGLFYGNQFVFTASNTYFDTVLNGRLPVGIREDMVEMVVAAVLFVFSEGFA